MACLCRVHSVGRSLMHVLVPTSVSYMLWIMVARWWSGFTEYTCDSRSQQPLPPYDKTVLVIFSVIGFLWAWCHSLAHYVDMTHLYQFTLSSDLHCFCDCIVFLVLWSAYVVHNGRSTFTVFSFLWDFPGYFLMPFFKVCWLLLMSTFWSFSGVSR